MFRTGRQTLKGVEPEKPHGPRSSFFASKGHAPNGTTVEDTEFEIIADLISLDLLQREKAILEEGNEFLGRDEIDRAEIMDVTLRPRRSWDRAEPPVKFFDKLGR